MNDAVQAQGRTVEEAVRSAMSRMGATDEADVEVEVLQEPKQGLLGLIYGQNAVVRVKRKLKKGEVAREFVQRVALAMGVTVTTSVREDAGHVYVSVEGGDELGPLIGRRGRTLSALQFLVNLAASRAGSGQKRVVVDVGGYRKRREEAVRALALRSAEKARRSRSRVALEPMNSHERRVVHLALRDDPTVQTHSEGEEPFRKVIVSYKK